MRLLRLFAVCAALCCTASAARIEGRLWDVTGPDRAPVANARVVILARPQSSLLGVTRSDAEGRFALDIDSPGEVRLEFSRNGFVPASGDSYRNADCTAGCEPFELEMVRAGVITGEITDDLGEPVVKARVALQCSGAGSHGGMTTTDDRGAYRLAMLRPNPSCKLLILQQRFGLQVVELESDPVEVEVTAGMRRSVPIALRAAASGSLKVTGIVQGIPPAGEGQRRALMAHRADGRPPGVMQLTNLLPDGSFELRGLLPGTYRFTAQSFGGSGRGEHFSLGRHEILSSLDGLTLTPREPWRVAGRVEFDGGSQTTPVNISLRTDDITSMIGIQAHPPDFQIQAHRPDAEPGLYRADLYRGELFITEIEAGGEVFPPDAVRLDEASVQSLVIRLSADFAVISGRIKADPTGTAAPHYLAALRPVGAAALPHLVRTVQADQQGRFRFEKIPPGEYHIAAWAGAGAADAHVEALWTAAREAVRVFPVEAGAEIEIELTAAPVGGAR